MARKINEKERKQIQKKLKAYEAEVRRKKIYSSFGYTFITVFFIVLFMMFIGGPFRPLLNFFGLRTIGNEEGGIYVDCSKRENRKALYCNKKTLNMDQSADNPRMGKRPDKFVPFTLHGS